MAEKVASLYAEISADTSKFEGGLKDVEKGLGAAGKQAGSFSDALKQMTGLDLKSLAGIGGIAAVTGALVSSAKAAADWGDEMGDLAQLTGASVEETSRMAAAFELVGVEVGTLQSAIKGMTNAGLQPNIATIKRLSQEYQALSDPVAKNEFLFKKFGRAGIEMAEIMGKSADELDRLTLAANNSGKVIGGETADAAERLNINMAIMQQRVEGAQIVMGNLLIPTLNDAFTGLENLVKGYGAVAILTAKYTGLISDQEAATRAAALANGELAAGYDFTRNFASELATETEELREKNRLLGDQTVSTTGAIDAWSASLMDSVPAAQDYAVAVKDIEQSAKDLATIIAGPVGQENENYIKQQAELRLKAQELTTELGKLETAQGKQFTVNNASSLSAAELTVAQLKLAEAQTKLSEETDPLKQAQLQVEVEKLSGKIAGATVTTTGFVDNSKRIGEIKTELDGVTSAFDANAAAHEEATARIVFGFIQQRFAADGLQEGEITALAKIGLAWGIYDQDTARVLESVDKSIGEHGANADKILSDLDKKIDDLPDSKIITLEVRQVGAIIGDENFGGWTGTGPKTTAGADTSINGMRAAGGPVFPGGVYLVGERGPELFAPAQAGNIVASGGGPDPMITAMLKSLPSTIARAVRDGMQQAR